MMVILFIIYYGKYDFEDLIGWVNGVFVFIYFVSMLVVVCLLLVCYRFLVVLSCLFCVIIVVGLGIKMFYVLGLFIVFVLLLWY